MTLSQRQLEAMWRFTRLMARRVNFEDWWSAERDAARALLDVAAVESEETPAPKHRNDKPIHPKCGIFSGARLCNCEELFLHDPPEETPAPRKGCDDPLCYCHAQIHVPEIRKASAPATRSVESGMASAIGADESQAQTSTSIPKCPACGDELPPVDRVTHRAIVDTLKEELAEARRARNEARERIAAALKRLESTQPFHSAIKILRGEGGGSK